MTSVIKFYLFLGALALGALYWLTRKGVASGAASAVAQAAVGAAGGAVAGVAEGIGTQVGLPMTDQQKCQAAMLAGDSFGASVYCDLATFLAYEKNSIFAGAVVQSGQVQGSQNNTLFTIQ